jgi:lipopolysaccharide exporter
MIFHGKIKLDFRIFTLSTLNKKIGIGVLWNLTGLLVNRGAGTIFTLFLAKFLAPSAFGLVAMVTIVFELANAFVNSGLGQALIRSKEVTHVDLSTVFYTNLGLSLFAYTLLFISAPYIAGFYHQPELTLLVQVMGLIIFINAAKVVQIAVLSRSMNFKTQMKAHALSVPISGTVAVIAAWQGWGVWSLVTQFLVGGITTTSILWFNSKWRPSLQYSTASFKRLFGYGCHLLAEALTAVLYKNSYLLVIGRFFGPEATGLYFFAKKISNLISEQLTHSVEQVTFPALSTLQDNHEELVTKYRQIIQLVMFMIAPLMAMLAALSPSIFELLFDDRWKESVPYVQILCIVGTLFPLHAMNINLLKVVGRTDLVFKVGLVKKITNITLLILSIPFGVIWVVVSQAVGTIIAVIPNTYYSEKLVNYTLSTQLTDIFKPIIAAITAGLAASWIANLVPNVFAGLGLGGIIGALIYLILGYLIKAEGLMIAKNKISSQLHKRRNKKN